MSGRQIILSLMVGSICVTSAAEDVPRRSLEYAPAPADNPLKGLVPYAGDGLDRFPHSLEFGYLPLSAIVVAHDRYDWTRLERVLDDIAGRGHQAVFRIYVEYPGRKDGIPQFLINEGLTVHTYRDTTSRPPASNITPDYSNAGLRQVLTRFIAELGKRFDGDPRIGFITAGLLGHWGEWHTYPREELFAKKDVQTEVMDAYESTFRITPVLLRYPVGPGTSDGNAPNAGRRFGYHDDSFAWATLDTGRKGDEWFYMTVLKAAGPEAVDKWKTQPIGGEIRPEAWGTVFDAKPAVKEIQDFRRCVQETHATWLMDTGMFRTKPSPERRERAVEEVRRMGYEFHVRAVTIGAAAAGTLPVEVDVENRGVAPFYYDWPVEYGAMAGRKLLKTWKGSGKLIGLLPGDPARIWKESLDLREEFRRETTGWCFAYQTHYATENR